MCNGSFIRKTIGFVLLLTNVALNAASTGSSCSPSDSLGSRDVIPVKIFAFDFDHTASALTSDNTGELLYRARTKYRNGGSRLRDAFVDEWKKLNRQQEKRYHELTVQALGSNASNRSGETELKQKLRVYIKKMDQVDRHLVDNIVKYNMVKDITTEALHINAHQIVLSPGLLTTLQRFRNQTLNVISAGLSKKFLQIVFQQHSCDVVVYCATLPFKNGKSTGEIEGLVTAFGKEKVLGKLIREAAGIKGYSVYVGNDYADVLALLKADIGIIINYTQRFRRVLHAFGIRTLPVTDWRKQGGCLHKHGNPKTAPVIYTAQSWYEIERLIFGSNPS